VVQHQQNYARIQELKRLAEENDQKVRDHIRSLADLRKEIASIPTAETTTSARDFSVDELLAYARFISPTTVPPTLRKKDLPPKPEPAEPQISNGIATPPPGEQQQAADSNPAYIKLSSTGEQNTTEQDKLWLNASTQLPFETWPNHGVMLLGRLADIQRMRDQGIDPAEVLTPEEQAEKDEKERLRKEEQEKQRREQEAARRSEYAPSYYDAESGGRRGTMNDVFDPDA
jgi:hypothetical protein